MTNFANDSMSCKCLKWCSNCEKWPWSQNPLLYTSSPDRIQSTTPSLFNIADNRFTATALLLGLIPTVVASLQLNVALPNVQPNYMRRVNTSRLLSLWASILSLKRLGRGHRQRPRTVWTRKGHTSDFWDYFDDQIVRPGVEGSFFRFRVFVSTGKNESKNLSCGRRGTKTVLNENQCVSMGP